jgi:hypothetical protein
MVSKAKFGLFLCGLVGSGVAAFTQLPDQAAATAASPASMPNVSSDPSNEELQRGMTQVRAAAERPFAAFAQTAPQR